MTNLYRKKTANNENPHPNIILKDSNTTVKMLGQGMPEVKALLEKLK